MAPAIRSVDPRAGVPSWSWADWTDRPDWILTTIFLDSYMTALNVPHGPDDLLVWLQVLAKNTEWLALDQSFDLFLEMGLQIPSKIVCRRRAW
jgi:hypothetical protein